MSDVERILQWPKETRSEQERHQLAEHRKSVFVEMRSLAEQAERDDRDLTDDEAVQFASLQAEFDRLSAEVSPVR